MKAKPCLLFKLKSGEEVIAHIVKKTKLKYIVENPYIFKMSTVVHPVTIQAHEIVTIHDWLKLSETKTSDIPTNHIVYVVSPSTETKNIYIKELSKKTNKKKTTLAPKPDKTPHVSNNLNKKDKITDEEMQNLLKDMFGSIFETKGSNDENSLPFEVEDMGTTPEEFNKNPIDLYNELFPPKDKRKSKNIPLVQMSLLFPPEVMIDLMESGLINVNDVNKIAKEVKRKLKWTGDERHRTDFGNKSTDWNSNPNSDDYH